MLVVQQALSMAIPNKALVLCLAACVLFLVVQPAKATGTCASTYLTAEGDTRTIVAANCRCSSAVSKICVTNVNGPFDCVSYPDGALSAGTLLKLPIDCIQITANASINNTITAPKSNNNNVNPYATPAPTVASGF